MRPIHVVGLLLWRGGMLLVAGTVLFEAARFVLRFFRPPLQIEIGAGLLVAGAALVILSLVLERVRDARSEKGLRE
jgi:hypothetical protein